MVLSCIMTYLRLLSKIKSPYVKYDCVGVHLHGVFDHDNLRLVHGQSDGHLPGRGWTGRRLHSCTFDNIDILIRMSGSFRHIKHDNTKL